ncbi:MAG: integration host factor subunit alpha [Rickettsiales bacterium]|nr:integration host factor subunit alpha [Rickettsiales bacterium]|tara:strand:- start:30662 stop:30976 length:315 start_codon:yes stop_codon:yes gene_type:complete
MSKKTITRADIGEALRKKCGLSRAESMSFVESVIDEVCTCIKKEKEVKIPLFGVFGLKHKKARIGRNPKTMEEAKICERNVATFRVSRVMKDRVNLTLSKKRKS